MMRLLVASCAFALLGAADPSCVPPMSGGDGPSEGDDERQSSGDCLAACAGGKTLSKTDAQTCRLLCEKTSDDPGPASTLMARYALCTDRCDPRAKTDAATCALNCGESSLSSLKITGEARSCAAGCLEAWQSCEDGCSGSKTDAATCRLNCEQTATSCADACMK